MCPVHLTRTSTILLNGLKDSSDPVAWSEFDSRYRPILLTVARRLGLHGADAEDAVQETMTTFMLAYRQEKYERDKGRLRDWLYGMARHKIREIQRKLSKKELPFSGHHEDNNRLDEIEDHRVKAVWDQEWNHAILRQALDQLKLDVSPRMCDIFDLYVLQQWPVQRIASQLKVSHDVIYKTKSRCSSSSKIYYRTWKRSGNNEIGMSPTRLNRSLYIR